MALEVLSNALGLPEQALKRRDLSDLAGLWIEDPDFDAAIADQDRVDPELWR